MFPYLSIFQYSFYVQGFLLLLSFLLLLYPYFRWETLGVSQRVLYFVYNMYTVFYLKKSTIILWTLFYSFFEIFSGWFRWSLALPDGGTSSKLVCRGYCELGYQMCPPSLAWGLRLCPKVCTMDWTTDGPVFW